MSNRIAIIPARGGSMRVPRKNIKPFLGKPMFFYPLAAAQLCELFDLVVVSTDDAEIAQAAFAVGATVVPRPEDDGSRGTQELAGQVLDQLDADGMACVIYPCSPLLLPEDLRAARRLMVGQGVPYVYSVGPDGRDAGCFYMGAAHAFRGHVPLDKGTTYQLPEERTCDVNTPADWIRAESLYAALRRAP